ncbi:MAG: hypothetical protein ABFQ95_05755, partial [Pseudomonadota bacterium]
MIFQAQARSILVQRTMAIILLLFQPQASRQREIALPLPLKGELQNDQPYLSFFFCCCFCQHCCFEFAIGH